MKVRITSVSDDQIWYSDLIGSVFDVFSLDGSYYFIPIPFEYLHKFSPYMFIFKKDCEVVNEES